MKIVINLCFGGFGVTRAVYEELGIGWDGFGYMSNELFNIEDSDVYKFRTNTSLIKAIEEVGLEASSGRFAKLSIITIPDNINWEIEDYDGIETVHECHKSWG